MAAYQALEAAEPLRGPAVEGSEIAASPRDHGAESGSEDEEQGGWAYRIATNDKWNMVVAGVILSSTLAMAIETDNREWPCWVVVNNLILLFFVVEISFRLTAFRCAFFCNEDWGWNNFDFLIVVFGVLDLWVPGTGQSTGVSKYMQILRVVRILRILRVLRLFKQCKQLMQLVAGIMESMQIVMWIALLMFMLTLIYAILITEMVGNAAEKFEDPASIREKWGGVMASLITLFQYLTLDDWSNMTREVTDTLPWMRVVFISYVFIGAFAMLSLLTGVVADHMNEVSQCDKEVDKAEGEEELTVFLDELEKRASVHSRMGAQGLSWDDFHTLMQDGKLVDDLDELGVSVTGHEAQEFWDCLDRDGKGWLTWAEFKSGMHRFRASLHPKDMLRMRHAAERVARTLDGGRGEAASARKLDEVNEFINDAEKRLGDLEGHLRGFMTWVAKGRPAKGALSTLMGM